MQDSELLRLLGRVLVKLGKKYDSHKDETGIKKYISGVSVIYVKGEDKFWFFDDEELIDWMVKVDDSIEDSDGSEGSNL